MRLARGVPRAQQQPLSSPDLWVKLKYIIYIMRQLGIPDRSFFALLRLFRARSAHPARPTLQPSCRHLEPRQPKTLDPSSAARLELGVRKYYRDHYLFDLGLSGFTADNLASIDDTLCAAGEGVRSIVPSIILEQAEAAVRSEPTYTEKYREAHAALERYVNATRLVFVYAIGVRPDGTAFELVGNLSPEQQAAPCRSDQGSPAKTLHAVAWNAGGCQNRLAQD